MVDVNFPPKREIVRIGKLLYKKCLNAAYIRNLSIKEKDKICITPTRFNKGFLTGMIF
jgi:ribulose-5-phosphate 4-epimerase/fuculose-1-phosphate aldolase